MIQFIDVATLSNPSAETGLKSRTAEVQLADKFTLDGQPVVLIDAPGFDNSYTECDTTALISMMAFLAAM